MTIGMMLRVLERHKGLGWHHDVSDPALRRLLQALLDPVTLCIPKEPVAMSDGFLYDRRTLERLLRADNTILSPVTRQQMRTSETGVFEEKIVAAVLVLVMDHFRLS